MKTGRQIRTKRTEKGVALLISIFILLLISVVAIALIVSSGTETALAGNYRSATGVYYAALAGLEEARGRLLTTDPNSFKNTAPNMLPPPGNPFDIGYASYVLNPGPTDPADTRTVYPDKEYDNEFGPNSLAAATINTTASIWTSNTNPLSALPVSGPLYKWVRINAVSEKSLNVDVDGDNQAQSTTPLYYDGTRFSNDSTVGPQVLELTSLAVLPNGSQKLLQYLVTPVSLTLSFPAALTLDGPVGTFNSSFNSNFWVSGVDRQHGAPYPSSCPPNDPNKYAIGATSNGDVTQVFNGIPPYSIGPPAQYHYNQYHGINPTPSIGNIQASLIPAFQTVNSLDGPQGVVQMLAASAIQVAGPANSLPDMGAPDRLVTTIVRGDLTLSGDGYGLLIVTGDLTLDGHATWHGVILVIGQGELTIPNLGFGEIDGAVLIARTRHNDLTLRTNLGNVTFDTLNPNNSNNGFWYNSCWIQAVLPSGYYKILSFHEISQ